MELDKFSLEKQEEAHWIQKSSSDDFQIDASPKYSVLVCWQWFLTQVPWARVVDSLTLYAKCCVPIHLAKGVGRVLGFHHNALKRLSCMVDLYPE